MKEPDCFRLIVSKKHLIEAAVCRSSSKQVILKILQYSQESAMFKSLFNKVALKFFIKKRLQHRNFPVNIAQFLRTAFAIEHWCLLLTLPYYIL